MRCCFLRLADHALDFFQLFHQMQLRGQAAGGIGNHHVATAGATCGYRIKTHRSRIAAFLADNLHTRAISPDAELLTRGCAEGVGRSKQHLLISLGQMLRELANAGCLAGTVHSHHHHHRRCMLANGQCLLERRK